MTGIGILKGRIDEGKAYERTYDPSYKLEEYGKEIGFLVGLGHQKGITKRLTLEVGGNDNCFCGL